MRIGLLLVFIFFSCSIFSKPFYSFTPELIKAHGLILKLKADSSEEILAKEQEKNPENLANILIASYIDFFRVFISEDIEIYTKLIKKENIRKAKLDSFQDSPYYRYVSGELFLQCGILKIRFGHETEGILDIVKAYRLFVENDKLFPEFNYHKKSLGLLLVVLGSIPQNYQWIIRILGFKTDVDEGIKKLDLCIQKEDFLKVEALMIKEWTTYFVLNKEKNDSLPIKNIAIENPDNLLVIFLYTSILKKFNKGEDAIGAIESFLPDKSYIQLPQLYYLKSILLLQKGLYKESVHCMEYFLIAFKGNSQKKDACYRLSTAYKLLGNDVKSAWYLKKTLLVGNTFAASDKYAMKMAMNKNSSDIRLIKARLLFDGGYYQESESTLRNLDLADFTSKADKVEFIYRRARILDMTGNDERALVLYEKTIQLQKDDVFYFAPNACLQLGYIYTKTDKIKAAFYFKKAMSYRKHDYKNSIDNKANAELNRLKLN